MSTNDSSSSDTLTAEFRDGQLQIVEVTPFETENNDGADTLRPESAGDASNAGEQMQILNADGKDIVQLDLLNLTLVRCENGANGEMYKLVSTNDHSHNVSDYITPDTVQFVQANDDAEDQDKHEAYVMMESEQGLSLVLESDLQKLQTAKPDPPPQPPQTATQVLDKMRALKRAKHIWNEAQKPKRGRKPAFPFPPPQQLLSSASFRLYLYNCKLCTYKCNAIRELSEHKNSCHGAGARPRAGRSGPASLLQCSACPYKGQTHMQLLNHVQREHLNKNKLVDVIQTFETSSDDEDTILVCGACGFESESRPCFRKHIREQHGADCSGIK